MKKLLIFLFSISIAGFSSADYLQSYQFGSASYTASSEGVVPISSSTMRGGLFLGVVIDSPSLGGSVTFSDAFTTGAVGQSITLSTFAILSLCGSGATPLGGPYYIPFNIKLSSGLTYKTVGNTGGITIIYKSLIPQ